MLKKIKAVGNLIFLVIAISLIFSIVLFFLILRYSEIVDSFSKNACNNIIKFSNPLYNEKKIDDNNELNRFSNFGKKGDKIYRIYKGGWNGDSDRCAVIKNVDTDTFEVLSQKYAKDKSRAYIQDISKREVIIKNINSETFVVLDEYYGYSKDKNNIYKESNILREFDPDTFIVLRATNTGNARYVKDKNKIKRVSILRDSDNNFTEKVDVETFQVLDEEYAKDKNYVYDKDSRVIEGADPITFEVVKKNNVCYQYGSPIVALCSYDYDAWDKYNKYMDGKRVGKSEGIITDKTEMFELKKIDFDKEQVFVSQLGLPGSAVWDKTIMDGRMVLKSGLAKNSSGYPYNVAIFVNMEMPRDAEFMKFRFNFRDTGSAKQSFILSSLLGTEYVFRAIAEEYPPNIWQDSGWISIGRYAGATIQLNFNLARYKDYDNNDEGVVELDNIIFAKEKKK